MIAAQMQKVVVRREGIIQGDDDGLIPFSPLKLWAIRPYNDLNLFQTYCSVWEMLAWQLSPQRMRRSAGRCHGGAGIKAQSWQARIRPVLPAPRPRPPPWRRVLRSELVRPSVAPTVPQACIYFSQVSNLTFFILCTGESAGFEPPCRGVCLPNTHVPR